MSRFDLIKSRRFRLLVMGEAASLVGDQFTRIAIIWLILSLTNSSAAMGAWLAFSTIPRAVFILVGGALTDRFAPRAMMIASNAVRLALIAALAIAAAADAVAMPMLYGFAAILGISGALYLPAVSAIAPQIAAAAHLHQANAAIQGLMHFANLAGPPLAALLLAQLAGLFAPAGGADGDQSTYAALFALDAATYVASLATLIAIGRLSADRAPDDQARRPNPVTMIMKGARYAARDPRRRLFLLVAVAANFGIGGPIAVGLPLLAKFVLPQGVVALGTLSAASAAGGLVGLALAGLVPFRQEKTLFRAPFLILPLLALMMIALGRAEDLGTAAALIGAMTMMAAFVDIQAITWLQRSVDKAYLGRVVSVLQFGALGLTPVSMALAGYLGGDVAFMFAAFGAGMLIASAALLVAMRRASAANSPQG